MRAGRKWPIQRHRDGKGIDVSENRKSGGEGGGGDCREEKVETLETDQAGFCQTKQGIRISF